MSNDVTTRVKVFGDKAQTEEFKKLMFVNGVEDGEPYINFDFDRIVPMPPIIKNSIAKPVGKDIPINLVILRGTSVPPFTTSGLSPSEINRIRRETGMQKESITKVADAFLSKNPEIEEEGMQRVKFLAETGYDSWYTWSIKHWNTKWNAYNFLLHTESPLEFSFTNVWYFPFPIFEALAKKFNLLSFRCYTYDDAESFCGAGFFSGENMCDFSDNVEKFKLHKNREEIKRIYQLVFEQQYEDRNI